MSRCVAKESRKHFFNIYTSVDRMYGVSWENAVAFGQRRRQNIFLVIKQKIENYNNLIANKTEMQI